METANFSEFSYGFALTHELIVSAPGGVTAAPVFPSLVEEAHVGFDLMIKLRPRTTARRHGIRKGRRFIPLYLQFKLCERPKRRPNGPLAKVLAKLFLRFPLRCEPTSLGPSQHDLLLRLNSARRHVYYAAPHFWNTDRFNTYFAASALLQHSLFVEPAAIGRASSPPRHFIWYDRMGNAIRTSEPVRIEETRSGEKVLDLIREELASKQARVLNDQEAEQEFEELANEMSRTSRQRLLSLAVSDAPAEERPLRILRAAGIVAAMRYQSTLFIAQVDTSGAAE